MAPVKSILAASMLVAAQLVSGHAVITNAVGDAGGSGMALGVVTSTPRDGTRRNPFQQDATRFRGASADTFGETVGQGANNLESGMSNIMAETGDALPQVTPGGKLTMTLHQVNSDGAGPYQCMINADGTGTTWENIQVSQNVEGNQRGRNRQGSASDHPLVADIPANQQCTGTAGGQTGVCLVRCQNPANAGPFGGVVPVQMAAAAAPAAGGVAATPAAGGVAATPAAGGVAATPAVGGVGATPATGAGAVPAAGAGAVPAAGANTPATGAGAGVSTPATGAAPATGAGAAPATGAGAVPAAGAGAVPAAGANTPATGAGRNGAGRNGAGRNGAGNAADDDDEEEEEETGNTRGNGRNRNNNRRAVAWNA